VPSEPSSSTTLWATGTKGIADVPDDDTLATPEQRLLLQAYMTISGDTISRRRLSRSTYPYHDEMAASVSKGSKTKPGPWGWENARKCREGDPALGTVEIACYTVAYAKLSLKKYRPIAARNEEANVSSGLL
jgi:hypothetical protein